MLDDFDKIAGLFSNILTSNTSTLRTVERAVTWIVQQVVKDFYQVSITHCLAGPLRSLLAGVQLPLTVALLRVIS